MQIHYRTVRALFYRLLSCLLLAFGILMWVASVMLVFLYMINTSYQKILYVSLIHLNTVLLNISNITITEYCQRTVFVILTKGWLLVNITKVMTIKSCRFKSVKKSLLIKCCKKHAFDIITFSRSLLYCEIVIVITLS